MENTQYIHRTEEIAYRPDLDGLRAVAVWSVIVYHMGRDRLPGGYLGVDIFFVLSGFLITTILWRDTLQHRFSIVKFYDRRIRRIMPALIAVLVFTSVVTVFVLLPSDLIGYGKSLLASLGFIANVYFWRDTNYFAQAAETKPLLHLWSLGIEEQFYIIFPWLVAGLAKFRKSAAVPCILALVLVSLAADVILRLKGGASPAFFLLPTRMWELGIGGVLAVMPQQLRLQYGVREAMSAAGAILIGVGIIFPSLVPAAVPVAVTATVGTTLILLAGNAERQAAVNRLLQTGPFVFFGLISYSLYLWHWPTIVLGQYYLVRDFTLPESCAAIVFMVGAAYVSWRYIERPFRMKSMPIQKVRWAAGAGVAALACAGLVLIRANGLPWRLNPQAARINEAVDTNYRCPVTDYLLFGASRACLLNLPSRKSKDADVVLLGNSHAQMYAPLIREIVVQRHLHGLLVPLNSCLPTVAANTTLACITAARTNLEAISRLKRAKTVILAMTWSYDTLTTADGNNVSNAGSKVLIAAINDLIERLKKKGKSVVLVGPIAEPEWDVASITSRELAFGRPLTHPLFRSASAFFGRFGSLLAYYSSRADIKFVRPDLVQCRQGRCEFIVDGECLFADSNHISQHALYRFRTVFERAIP